jgi:DNA-binding transcriptional MerR regulator
METRVLTLFDDEDFFPQEETFKKASKKTTAASEEPTDTNNVLTGQPLFAEDTATEPEIVALPTEQENTNIEIADPEPEIIAEPEAAGLPIAQEEVTISITEPESDPAPEAVAEEEELTEQEIFIAPTPPQPQVPAADDELSKQLLHELIQQDYTAFIHRDYPFDIQQASVVKKDKEIKPAELVPEEVATETEDEVFEEIVPLPEWNLDKKYYTIGEVAQLFAVNTSHIRFWTNEFKLKPRTTRKGDRLYSPKDIAELRLIHHLVKEKKHTIKGAREKLKVEKAGVNHKLDLKESLTGLRDMLIQIKEQL